MSNTVSIVLPTYNGEKYIKQSIESIINQTYTNWELIIVNDCSTDNTLNIINEYQSKDSRIKVISNYINLKLPNSLNIGFRKAKGKYYTWTSDDNIYKIQAIETMVNYLETHPDIGLVSCKYDEIDENNKFLRTIDKKNKRNLDRFLRRNIVGACFMYRQDIKNKVGEYDEKMFCAEDYDYWCRIALVSKIAFLPDNLYQYRLHTNSLSSTKQELIKQKDFEIRKKYVLAIMQKNKYTDKKQIQVLIKLYLRNKKETDWLKFCIDISVNTFVVNFLKYSILSMLIHY